MRIRKAGVLFYAIVVTTTFPIGAGAVNNPATQQIQTLISSTYDKPEQKVKTSPVAVVDDYAVADWIQGKRGGRALLHRINGKWAIMACGADGLKDIKTLTDAGITESAAKTLVTQLISAEKSLSPDLVKRFSLFGTKDDPVAQEHHHPK